MCLFAKWTSKHDEWKRLGGIFSQYRKKTRSLQFIRQFYQIKLLKRHQWLTVVIANNIEIWFVTDQYVEKLFESNHEEADTRMALHALYRNTNAVIVSEDTDVLILLVHMCALKNIPSRWCMKKDNEKFIDIGKIVEYFGKDVILKLPHIHAETGCVNLLEGIGVPSTINEKTVGKIQNLFKQCATPEWKMNQLQRQEWEFATS